MAAFDPGVPLSHYREHGDRCKGVRVTCLSCMAATDYDLEVVIARLSSRGLDAGNIGIRAVAKYVRAPCAQCGAMRWATTPAW